MQRYLEYKTQYNDLLVQFGSGKCLTCGAEMNANGECKSCHETLGLRSLSEDIIEFKQLFPSEYADLGNDFLPKLGKFVDKTNDLSEGQWSIPGTIKYFFINKIGYVVPTKKLFEEILSFVDRNGTVVFPAAGLGFLPRLLRMTAFANDVKLHIRTSDLNTHTLITTNNQWTGVIKRDAVVECTNTNNTDTLVISWAPPNSDLGFRMLEAFKGDRLVVIGEERGGSTADDAFFDLLDSRWEEVPDKGDNCTVEFRGMHGNAQFFIRRTVPIEDEYEDRVYTEGV